MKTINEEGHAKFSSTWWCCVYSSFPCNSINYITTTSTSLDTTSSAVEVVFRDDISNAFLNEKFDDIGLDIFDLDQEDQIRRSSFEAIPLYPSLEI